MFNDNGASLNVLVAEPSAAYTIDVYDPSTMTLLAQKTGSAMNGIISENWPGTYSNGSQFSGNTVQVVYNVPPASPTTATLNRVTSSETMGPHDGFEFAYFYTPTKSSSLKSSFGAPNGIEGSLWRGMMFAVDSLFAPPMIAFGGPNYYVSGFNYYDFQGGNPHGNGANWGYPGYIGSQSDLNIMISDMLNADVKNMYISGHGNPTQIGSSRVPPELFIDCQVMADEARNTDYFWGASGAPGNPYRFVFLDGCNTASGNFWPKAFGILPLAPNAAGNNPALGPQAFVGWGGLSTAWTAGIHIPILGYADKKSICMAWSYSQTLGEFYELWQTDEYSLAECIVWASTADQRGQVPLSVGPDRKKFTCYSNIGPSPYQSFSINFRVWFPAPLYVIGHSGLTRNGSNPLFDGYYARPW